MPLKKADHLPAFVLMRWASATFSGSDGAVSRADFIAGM
jgi:hypothetical protein